MNLNALFFKYLGYMLGLFLAHKPKIVNTI